MSAHPSPDLRQLRRALVYGLGRSGRAATALLRRRGVEVVGVDAAAPTPEQLAPLVADSGVVLHLGGEPAVLPAELDALIVSPGVPLDRPLLREARRCGVPLVAEVELAWQWLDGTVVGITGSNGKSTTTALTGTLLAAAGVPVEVCGNIGTPLSAVVDGEPGRTFVVELSSFQLETIATLRPRAAALLNLSPDHLDRHGSDEAYLAAKRRIFERQHEGDVAVLNADDEMVAATATTARRRLFSRRAPVADGLYLEGDAIVEIEPGIRPHELFRRDDLRLAGVHNLENAMAAALLARACGAEPGAIVAGLRAFVGLPHRLELVGELNGVTYWNDSKGTNVGATARSLEGFPDGSVHLILGGRNKGADLAALAPLVGRKARRAYLIGEAAPAFAAALAGVVPLDQAGTLGCAIAAAAAVAQEGEAVVLSPACASFDQFRDFEQRGEVFAALVAELVGRRSRG